MPSRYFLRPAVGVCRGGLHGARAGTSGSCSLLGGTMSGMTRGSLAIALILAFACSTPAASRTSVVEFFAHREDAQNRASDKPVPKSASTKKVTVLGHKDPAYEVWIGTQYSTNNESCRSHSSASLFLGAPAVPQVVTDLKRVPVGVSDFTIDLYLDQYAPGDCQWLPNGIVYAVFDPQLTAGPQTLNVAFKASAGATTRVKLTQTCSVVPWDQSISGRRLRCLWVERFTPETYSISLDGGTAELSYFPER